MDLLASAPPQVRRTVRQIKAYEPLARMAKDDPRLLVDLGRGITGIMLTEVKQFWRCERS